MGRTLVLQPHCQYLSVQPVQVTFHVQQQGEAHRHGYVLTFELKFGDILLPETKCFGLTISF